MIVWYIDVVPGRLVKLRCGVSKFARQLVVSAVGWDIASDLPRTSRGRGTFLEPVPVSYNTFNFPTGKHEAKYRPLVE